MSPRSSAALKQFRDDLAAAQDETYELTLFVNGASDLSARAIDHARLLCDLYLAGRHHLSVVDVCDHPPGLLDGGLIATPTLVKYLPLPVSTLVGDLSNADWNFLSTDSLRKSPRSRRVPRLSTVEVTTPPLVNRRARSKKAGAPAVRAGDATAEVDTSSVDVPDAIGRLAEAQELLRAVGAGEVDAFVVSDGADHQRVFTLSTADRPYRMFVENMRDGAATVSSAGLILYANRRLGEMLSCSRASIVGSPLARFVVAGVPAQWYEIRDSGGLGATTDVDLLDGDGVAIPVRVGSSPLELEGERLTCLTFTDLRVQKAQDRQIVLLGEAQAERMADLQVAQAALTEQATHDALTGLPNRTLLVDRIDQALFQAKRTGRCTAVLFVDLDRFKLVNDTKGHAAGDAVLKRVAKLLVAALRPMDTVARIGGDEFVILAPDVEDHLGAVDIGNRILAHLSRRPESEEEAERVAASVGISVSLGGRGTAEILLKEADTAMYKAKSLGRGRSEVFDAALRRQAQQRSTGRRMIQSALSDNRIVAYYQPIVDLSNGKVVGFEALARIVKPDGSILAPAAFLPTAEDSGLVVPLGVQILEMACRKASSWQRAEAAEAPLAVAVNLSSRQFEPGNLPSLVRGALELSGLDPGRLHLELIETAIIDLHPDILQQLGLMRDMGVQIGLDDFGTGYASLTHLRRLPLTFVKIDRSFVNGLDTDQQDDRIVSAVVELAANLRLRSIAEGIETSHQLQRLRELGCDQAQGYLFARPLPPDDVEQAIGHLPW